MWPVTCLAPTRGHSTRAKLRALGAALVAAAALLWSGEASAHCFVGARFFPATVVVDDPCVADELSLPTISLFRNGDDPSANQFDISAEYSKRLTYNLGVSIGANWTQLTPPGGPSVSGFQNLETLVKFQFLTVPEHELVMSMGFGLEWGNTGSTAVGAEKFTTVMPTLFVGKGFGDLPDQFGWMRALAFTAQVGFAVPTSPSTVTVNPDTGDTDIDKHPQFLRYGGTLQFSMPYLNSNIVDLGLPDFFNHLIPIVEADFQSPIPSNFSTAITTGTINPGVIWVGSKFQVALEAIIPINRASGTGIGGALQFHVYLDDLFPTSIGRPIFGK